LAAGLASFPFFAALLRIGAYLAVAVLLYGLHVSPRGLLWLAPILFMAAAGTVGFGLISAGIILVCKKGDPLAWLLSALMWLLGGVYFPRELLPGSLQIMGEFLPLTAAIEAMRIALLQNGNWKEILIPLGKMLFLTAGLTPLGFLIWNRAVRRAKREGTLREY
jgi:ABC-2 type transport system permease protein